MSGKVSITRIDPSMSSTGLMHFTPSSIFDFPAPKKPTREVEENRELARQEKGAQSLGLEAEIVGETAGQKENIRNDVRLRLDPRFRSGKSSKR